MKKLLDATFLLISVLIWALSNSGHAEEFGYTKQTADGIHIRLITLASPLRNGPEKTATWELPGYTAQDVLKMIEELRKKGFIQ